MPDFTQWPWNMSPLVFIDPRARSSAPLPGESNLGYGLRQLPLRLFRAGDQSMRHGPGRLGAYIGEESDKSLEYGYQNAKKGLHYAFAPATGGPAPAKPPGVPAAQARPFSQ